MQQSASDFDRIDTACGSSSFILRVCVCVWMGSVHADETRMGLCTDNLGDLFCFGPRIYRRTWGTIIDTQIPVFWRTMN